MKTTLDIDKDVLDAVKELARKHSASTGQVVSQLLRKALTGQTENLSTTPDIKSKAPTVAGFKPFPAGKAVVTIDSVNRLRDAEGV